jgi:ATP-binding cassette subfamily B protein
MQIPLWKDERALIGALGRRAELGQFRQEESIPLFGDDVETQLRTGGAFSLQIGSLEIGKGGFAGVLGVRGGKAAVLDEDLSVKRIALERLVDAVLERAAGTAVAETDSLVEACGVTGRRRAVARRAILKERLGDRRIGSMRRLCLDPGAGMARQMRETGMIGTATAFVLAHVAEACVWLMIWWAAGQASLSGRLDPGWMWGWTLLLAALVPLRIWAARAQGTLSIGVGGLLKQRLLAGALRLEPGEVAKEGAGGFFSRVTEAEAVETLALSGGLSAVVSVVELTLAGAVLAMGASGGLLVTMFLAWLALAGGIAWRFARERSRWTDARLAMTHDLIEQMTGHRTRLVQEPPDGRHVQEDEALSAYHTLSARMDRWGVLLNSFVPGGWLLAGVAALMPAFSGSAQATSLAVGLGGVLLAWQALRSALAGASNLIGAGISWRAAAPLFRSATKMEPEEDAECLAGRTVPSRTVIDASDVTFRYRQDGPLVLNGVDLRMERGDQALLEGASGRGKSTLVSILCGLREPVSGLLTSGGLDRASIGSRQWRKKVAAAPQYHENHIVTGTLAFNLLMGRAWPPAYEDMREAVLVCGELGLGDLLERMPAGIQQMVGDTGWQLSQGERSRVFLARALLQKSEMTILDESFAALDPENLRRAMECSIRRANTLLVVAHP